MDNDGRRFGIWNFLIWDFLCCGPLCVVVGCEHEPMGVGVVGVGTASLVGGGCDWVHRSAVSRPSPSSTHASPGRALFVPHTARPPFGCSAIASQAVMVLGAVRLPQSGPWCIPRTAFACYRCTAGRAWYAGPPPWGAARLATLGCAAVMLFAG